MAALLGWNNTSIHSQTVRCHCIGGRGVLQSTDLPTQRYNTLKAQTNTNTCSSYGCHGRRCSCAKQSSCVNHNGSHSELKCHVDDISVGLALFFANIFDFFSCFCVLIRIKKAYSKTDLNCFVLYWENDENSVQKPLKNIDQTASTDGRLFSINTNIVDALWLLWLANWMKKKHQISSGHMMILVIFVNCTMIVIYTDVCLLLFLVSKTKCFIFRCGTHISWVFRIHSINQNDLRCPFNQCDTRLWITF